MVLWVAKEQEPNSWIFGFIVILILYSELCFLIDMVRNDFMCFCLVTFVITKGQFHDRVQIARLVAVKARAAV